MMSKQRFWGTVSSLRSYHAWTLMEFLEVTTDRIHWIRIWIASTRTQIQQCIRQSMPQNKQCANSTIVVYSYQTVKSLADSSISICMHMLWSKDVSFSVTVLSKIQKINWQISCSLVLSRWIVWISTMLSAPSRQAVGRMRQVLQVKQLVIQNKSQNRAVFRVL